jgi:hypothetical protein
LKKWGNDFTGASPHASYQGISLLNPNRYNYCAGLIRFLLRVIVAAGDQGKPIAVIRPFQYIEIGGSCLVNVLDFVSIGNPTAVQD